MTTEIIETLRGYIAHKQQQVDDLRARYGTGVRPGWVGEEIAILMQYKADAQADLAELEGQHEQN